VHLTSVEPTSATADLLFTLFCWYSGAARTMCDPYGFYLVVASLVGFVKPVIMYNSIVTVVLTDAFLLIVDGFHVF
jgi:hypothetical protein